MPGVYISFPFCAQKCTYCNFASGVFSKQIETEYMDALDTEIGEMRWTWTPETVYIGGGTPSTLETERFPRLLASVPGRPWREATIEAAPGSLTSDKVRAWRDSGINRVSLGVQSFVDAELRRTGRRHDASIVESDIGLLRGHGIGNISIDLITGLPAQTHPGWRASLEWVERLAVPHVSVYMLEVDDDSRLGRELLLGGLRYGAFDVPAEAAIVEFYEEAVARLATAGLARYEISNFALPGFESVHNRKYWRLEPYLGFGAGAHSFDGRLRWQNAGTAEEYVERHRQGRSAKVAETPAIIEEERFFVGLRLMAGVSPTLEEWRRFAAPVARFLDLGLLAREGDVLRLTSRGVLLSNEVFREFIHACA